MERLATERLTAERLTMERLATETLATETLATETLATKTLATLRRTAWCPAYALWVEVWIAAQSILAPYAPIWPALLKQPAGGILSEKGGNSVGPSGGGHTCGHGNIQPSPVGAA